MLPEELPAIIEVINNKIKKQQLSQEQQRTLLKILIEVDGSTMKYVDVIILIQERIKSLGPRPLLVADGSHEGVDVAHDNMIAR